MKLFMLITVIFVVFVLIVSVMTIASRKQFGHNLRKLLKNLVMNEADGILCYDIHGVCRFVNEPAEEYGLLNPNIHNIKSYFSKIIKNEFSEGLTDKSWDEEFEIGNQTKNFTIELSSLYDHRDKFVGCMFLIHDTTDMVNALKKEEYLSKHDYLTGLYKKDYFYSKVEKKLKDKPNETFMMVCSDIKDFKIVNDLFGQDSGDKILLSISNRFKSITDSEIVYSRLGSDRFAIFIPKRLFDEQHFRKVIKFIEDTTVIESFKVQLSLGIYEIPDNNLSPAVICDRALLAVSSIKDNYHDNIVYYDDFFRKNFLNEQQLSSEFEQALRQNQFHLYYQPQVTSEGEMLGAEALVRWFHPIRGMMMPVDFIGILEKNGLISRLDMYVWENVCQKLKQWKEVGVENHHISVNISSKDFLFIDIYEVLTGLIEKYDVSPNRMLLEITESAVMEDPRERIEVLKRLREYGFLIYIDNFGSGYSSLNSLKDIPLDAIKMDLSLLRKKDRRERGKVIIRMVILLAEQLGIDVVISAVETEEQFEYLKSIGCKKFQGYNFERPINVKQFEEQYLDRCFY